MERLVRSSNIRGSTHAAGKQTVGFGQIAFKKLTRNHLLDTKFHSCIIFTISLRPKPPNGGMMATQFKKTFKDHPSEQVFCFHTHSNKLPGPEPDPREWLRRIPAVGSISFSLKLKNQNPITKSPETLL